MPMYPLISMNLLYLINSWNLLKLAIEVYINFILNVIEQVL